jgi:hypothetical protein
MAGTIESNFDAGAIETSFTGLECWSAKFNALSGVILEFGGRVPNSFPNQNPKLTEEERMFKGTHAWFLRCPWLIYDQAGVKIGNEIDGLGLNNLVDAELREMRINPIDFGLFAVFSNDFAISVSNSVNGDGGTNFSLRIENVRWKFGFRRPPLRVVS